MDHPILKSWIKKLGDCIFDLKYIKKLKEGFTGKTIDYITQTT